MLFEFRCTNTNLYLILITISYRSHCFHVNMTHPPLSDICQYPSILFDKGGTPSPYCARPLPLFSKKLTRKICQKGRRKPSGRIQVMKSAFKQPNEMLKRQPSKVQDQFVSDFAARMILRERLRSVVKVEIDLATRGEVSLMEIADQLSA